MKVFNYLRLKQDIATRANRDDLTNDELDLALAMAQLITYRSVRLPSMEKSGQWEILSSGQVILPEDYLELVSMSVLRDGGKHATVKMTGFESCYFKEQRCEIDSGLYDTGFEGYRRSGSIYIVPKPTEPYCFVTYYSFPPFLQKDEDRNWFTDNAYDALFNAGMAEVFRALEDPIMSSTYDKKFERCIGLIQGQSTREALSGSNAVVSDSARHFGE